MMPNFERKKTLRAQFNCSSSESPQGHCEWQTCRLGEPDWPRHSTAIRSNRTGHCHVDIWRRGCRVWNRFSGEPGANVECSGYLRRSDRIFVSMLRLINACIRPLIKTSALAKRHQACDTYVSLVRTDVRKIVCWFFFIHSIGSKDPKGIQQLSGRRDYIWYVVCHGEVAC